MKLSAWDKLTLSVAPKWTLERLRARAAAGRLVRHFEAAQPGRRTSGWARNRGDANAVTAMALAELRLHARDLVRNNGWAKKAQRVIANNTVGWGIVPRPMGSASARATELWKAWADSTECDSAGRKTFAAIQHLVMRSLATDGEILVRRRPRREEDGLTIPLQLQLLEADYLDTSKDLPKGETGGPIIQGVEFDAIGRRAAYWLFPEHPGSSRSTGVSSRVPAKDIIHVAYEDRPGQVRGVSWYGASIVPLKDLDEYEDAELLRQKIAACFAAFVTDEDGIGSSVGDEDEEDEELVETFEPGMIVPLPPGKSITTASPPAVVEGTFSTRHLRKVAAGLLVTYEDLTGDYSQVNFSSARMARIAHWGNVRDWQWLMLMPQLCQGVWAWAMEAATTAGLMPAGKHGAEWTAPPMPMLEPDKEAGAYKALVRAGVMTHNEMVREQGGDPKTHWKEYAEGQKTLDDLGITLDSDARKVSAAGLTQERTGAGKGGAE
jgi:lambda family phage portal protein